MSKTGRTQTSSGGGGGGSARKPNAHDAHASSTRAGTAEPADSAASSSGRMMCEYYTRQRRAHDEATEAAAEAAAKFLAGPPPPRPPPKRPPGPPPGPPPGLEFYRLGRRPGRTPGRGQPFQVITSPENVTPPRGGGQLTAAEAQSIRLPRVVHVMLRTVWHGRRRRVNIEHVPANGWVASVPVQPNREHLGHIRTGWRGGMAWVVRGTAAVPMHEDAPHLMVHAAVIARAREMRPRLVACEESPIAHRPRRVGPRAVPAVPAKEDKRG